MNKLLKIYIEFYMDKQRKLRSGHIFSISLGSFTKKIVKKREKSMKPNLIIFNSVL